MVKEKGKKEVTWSSKMKEYGGGNFTFLSTDGDTITFIVVGLPILIKSVYQKKEQERIGCPVVTEDGYVLFICGKRLARKISKHEDSFATKALRVVRHGVEGDVNAKYEVIVLDDLELYERLSSIRKEEFNEGMIADSVKEAQSIMAG